MKLSKLIEHLLEVQKAEQTVKFPFDPEILISCKQGTFEVEEVGTLGSCTIISAEYVGPRCLRGCALTEGYCDCDK